MSSLQTRVGAGLLVAAAFNCYCGNNEQPAAARGQVAASHTVGAPANSNAAWQVQVATADIAGVSAAAQKGISSLLGAIPKSRLGDYGFSAEAELDSATIGPQYRMFLVAPFINTNDAALKPLDMWRVAIMAGGRSRALITVSKTPDGYVADAAGATGLAAELDEIERASVGASAAPLGRALIRVHKLGADFAVFGAPNAPLGGCEIVPLRAAQASLKLNSQQHLSADEFVGSLAAGFARYAPRGSIGP